MTIDNLRHKILNNLQKKISKQESQIPTEMKKSSNLIKTPLNSPQCQYFVTRKKRLCRMTVRPEKQYCGEHEPQPRSEDGKDDTRIPCPNDPKHTCYASKLEKHLSICNARQQEQPDYIIQNINAPVESEEIHRLPLSKIPLELILKVIEKVNMLYDTHLKDKIVTLSELPIHTTVQKEFNEAGRAESSLRHLRQASRLIQVVEDEELNNQNTCFVELGAGKGHLSYYAWWAWCQHTDSKVLLIDRASLRHKRDNKLRDNQSELDSSDDKPKDVHNVHRIRADLAHLALERVPAVQNCDAVVGYAKHLCGVATDYALRCITADNVVRKVGGAVMATCCHHRCERAAYLANKHLQALGINGEDFNIILGIVSWATCGDGRSRERRNQNNTPTDNQRIVQIAEQNEIELNDEHSLGTKYLNLSQQQREEIGRRAKALLDWGRVLYLKDRGFDARLVYYVPTSVSLENVCIVAKKIKL